MSESVSITDRKRSLRSRARRVREQASGARATAAVALARHGMALLGDRTPGTVSGFHPHETEIDCLPLLAALESVGWQVALPVVVAKGQPLEFRAWQVGAPLESGTWGIPVPAATNPTVTPDVVLVPLLAFDRAGYRLGYGGGFYDRSLAKLRSAGEVTAIGVGYAAQQVPACPHEPFDQVLDGVLTENGPVVLATAGHGG